jgi:aminomethyltransferase
LAGRVCTLAEAVANGKGANVGLRTTLYDDHVRAGARFVDFGGWDMPIQYSSIQEEHVATRTAAGVFDVGHMGRIAVDGDQDAAFLDHVLTNRIATMKPGQARYSLLLNDDGGTLDDVLAYRLERGFLLVVNAGNRAKVADWLSRHMSNFRANLRDITEQTSMIAAQGPAALELVRPIVGFDPKDLVYYTFREIPAADGTTLVSRTGYTGEDGVEILGSHEFVLAAWRRLLKEGASRGVRPAGLGARDTLRLEAAMPLYGHELTEAIDPIQAGLGWAVKAAAKDFIGRRALLERPPDRPVRVGLKLEGRRIARADFAVLDGGRRAGWITSGTFAPTLGESIAMAYVPPNLSAEGRELFVDIRGAAVPAKVAPTPFYRRGAAGGVNS